MDRCAKCGVIVEPGATDSLRACKQKDGTLLCVVCDWDAALLDAFYHGLPITQKREAA